MFHRRQRCLPLHVKFVITTGHPIGLYSWTTNSPQSLPRLNNSRTFQTSSFWLVSWGQGWNVCRGGWTTGSEAWWLVILFVEHAMIHTDTLFTEWRTIPISATSQTLLCRINNRALIGFPLCVSCNVLFFLLLWPLSRSGSRLARLHFASCFCYHGGKIPNRAPTRFLGSVSRSFCNWGHGLKRLRRYVATFITKASSRIKRGAKHLYPLIEERQKCMQEYGARWRDKPVSAPYFEMWST